jgi:hypothetical protein
MTSKNDIRNNVRKQHWKMMSEHDVGNQHHKMGSDNGLDNSIGKCIEKPCLKIVLGNGIGNNICKRHQKVMPKNILLVNFIT